MNRLLCGKKELLQEEPVRGVRPGEKKGLFSPPPSLSFPVEVFWLVRWTFTLKVDPVLDPVTQHHPRQSMMGVQNWTIGRSVVQSLVSTAVLFA